MVLRSQELRKSIADSNTYEKVSKAAIYEAKRSLARLSQKPQSQEKPKAKFININFLKFKLLKKDSDQEQNSSSLVGMSRKRNFFNHLKNQFETDSNMSTCRTKYQGLEFVNARSKICREDFATRASSNCHSPKTQTRNRRRRVLTGVKGERSHAQAEHDWEKLYTKGGPGDRLLSLDKARGPRKGSMTQRELAPESGVRPASFGGHRRAQSMDVMRPRPFKHSSMEQEEESDSRNNGNLSQLIIYGKSDSNLIKERISSVSLEKRKKPSVFKTKFINKI